MGSRKKKTFDKETKAEWRMEFHDVEESAAKQTISRKKGKKNFSLQGEEEAHQVKGYYTTYNLKRLLIFGMKGELLVYNLT